MRGLMMEFPLTVPAIVRRAATLFPHKHVITRRPDRSIDRRTYAEVIDRSRRFAAALRALGVERGDRVATLMCASHQHLEVYLAVPSIGAVLHTLNLRLHPNDLAYIINDAEDRVVLVDESLLPLWEKVRPHVSVAQVIVASAAGSVTPPVDGGPVTAYLDYEAQLLAGDPAVGGEAADEPLEESEAAAMCYTSGTTGRPKGVLYSHRALFLHSFAEGLQDCLGLCEADTVLPIVPMFHVNAWGLPFSTTLFGCNLVLPGPHLDAVSVAELLSAEHVTVTAGVPTVWMALLHELDENGEAYDLRALRALVVGGSAAPEAMIRAYQERHNIRVVHAWGMTEMTPVGTVCNLPSALQHESSDVQFRYRAKQGPPLPLVEVRARGERGLIPWDGETLGELEVRGPWVAAQYYHGESGDSRFCPDGWFKTGDIVRIDPSGCIELADRAKDLVKSGGEWISSVALENALMGHPAVAEAAVVAVPHPKWGERPLAAVVLRPGKAATPDDLRAFLAPDFAEWWLPDAFEFIDAIPRTTAGKFLKSALRDRFRDRYVAPASTGESTSV